MDDEVDDNILHDDDGGCHGDADDDRMAFPSINYNGTAMDIPTSDGVVEDHHHTPSFKQDYELSIRHVIAKVNALIARSSYVEWTYKCDASPNFLWSNLRASIKFACNKSINRGAS